MSPPDASAAPPRGADTRAVATPIVSRVGASGMQWTSLVETSALDAAANLGASPDSRCKDLL